MTEHSGGSGGLLQKFSTVAIMGAAAALALLPATCVFNGVASQAEFNGVQSQIMMLVEQGKMTSSKDGTPQPYLAKYKGQEYAINVTSALRTQNGQFRDAGGQVTQDSQTQTGDGAVRSQSYTSGYTVQGVISRVKGSESILRPFYNDGGQRAFTYTWEGTKPSLAPLSAQPTMGVASQVQIPAANPASVAPAQVAPAPPPPSPAG